jgi:nucleotide-binding universal stress UspA family protein
MNKRVLVPTDFSNNAKNAFEFAYHLFGRDAQYDLLNCYYNLPSYNDMGESYINILKENSEVAMAKEFDRIKENYDIVEGNLNGMSLNGFPAFGIKTACDEKTYDVIAMGTMGAAGMKEYFIGSNTADAISNVKVPLLVIPSDAKFEGVHKMLFAADYQFIDDDQIGLAIDIAKNNSSEFLALHVQEAVSSVDEENEQRVEKIILSRKIKDLKYKFIEKPEGNIEDSIEHYVGTHKIDLMIMVKREYTFFERLFKSSHTKKMTMHTKIPLLVVHE